MIEELVKQIETRFAELGERIADPEVIADRARYAEAGRPSGAKTKIATTMTTRRKLVPQRG